ncbi:MAG: hypothetical protein AVDCRST_MAG77-3639, partial [uncultured Chloroflexi bacterium]
CAPPPPRVVRSPGPAPSSSSSAPGFSSLPVPGMPLPISSPPPG